MGKAAVALAAAVVVGLGVLSQPDAAKAQLYTYPHERVDWMVGPGFFGFSGYPWPGPPFAWPTPKADLWVLLHSRAAKECVARSRSLLLMKAGRGVGRALVSRAHRATAARLAVVYALSSFQ